MGPYQPSPKAGTHPPRETKTVFTTDFARKLVRSVHTQKGYVFMLISTQISSAPPRHTEIAFLLHWRGTVLAIFRYKGRKYLLWS